MALKQKVFLGVVILGSIIGLIDASYLAILQIKGIDNSSCDFLGFKCNDVLNSIYSKFLGIPLSFWGVGYYLVLFLAAISYLSLKSKKILQLIELWLIAGVLVSLVLVYIQTVILKAFCLYCLVSEIIIFIVFISYLVVKKSKQF
jgi:uncharacterized membrane protein